MQLPQFNHPPTSISNNKAHSSDHQVEFGKAKKKNLPPNNHITKILEAIQTDINEETRDKKTKLRFYKELADEFSQVENLENISEVKMNLLLTKLNGFHKLLNPSPKTHIEESLNELKSILINLQEVKQSKHNTTNYPLLTNKWKLGTLAALGSLIVLQSLTKSVFGISEPAKILRDHEWCQQSNDFTSSVMETIFNEKLEEQNSWFDLSSIGLTTQNPFSCDDPTTWPLPEVNPSRLSSLEIQRKTKENGLAYEYFSLDSGETPDRCLSDAQNCLLSQSNLEGVDRSTPVIVMAHGFTATSYEWNDFARYIEGNSKGTIRYSQVTLGGHGRSTEDFKKSDWHDWGKPILGEYKALVEKGFSNISLVGSSTACALILEQLSSGTYSGKKITPKNIFLIDPIVEPLSFINSLAVRAGTFAGQSLGPTRASSPEEFINWYGDYPFASLQSLDELTKNVKSALDNGIELPTHTKLTVWASEGDPTVNPAGYKFIEQGIKPGEGGNAEYYPVESRLHVFTRLSGRPEANQEDNQLICGDDPPLTREEVVKQVKSRSMPFTPSDRQKQKAIFDKMLKSMMSE